MHVDKCTTIDPWANPWNDHTITFAREVNIPESFNGSQLPLQSRHSVLNQLCGVKIVLAGSILLQLLRHCLHLFTGQKVGGEGDERDRERGSEWLSE